MRRQDNGPGATTRRRLCAGVGTAGVLLAGLVAPGAAATETPEGSLGTASGLGVEVATPATELTQEHGTSPTGRWFVELAPRATTLGGSKAAVERAEDQLVAEAEASGVEVEVTDTFHTLWSGVSAEIDDEDIAVVAELPSVQAVYPVLVLDAPEPASFSVPEMRTALAMSGADVAQSELGLTGAGIKVGIIDTGVDYDHPDFGGTGTDGGSTFPTAKVVAGYDFVGDTFNADPRSPDYQPVPHPDPDPDDCQGHGTHVAGIVGADGDPDAGVRGVAPDVELGAYRVFGCDGSTTSDIMIKAMEAALADGMDVVNQSIGAAFQTWPEYPTAVASDNLVAAGVVMVASIGNSGASGTWSAGAPGVGKDVIGVASYENTHVMSQAFEVDGEQVLYAAASNAPEPPTEGSLPLVALGATGTDEARACVPVDPEVADGSAVLIERGASTQGTACDATFYAKALAAQQAGAAAVVLYNNVPGLFSPSVAGAEEITIPVVAIGRADGLELTEVAADGEATLTWTDETASAVNPTGGLISSFSSYGMAADLSLKPDLGAPGGNIYSTYPLEQGGYATLSGTSMSAPHVAGAVALLLEDRDVPAGDVRDVLLNSAAPTDWSLVPGAGYIEPVHRQGAGMLAIDEAIQGTTVITPGKLSLGESEHGPVTRTLTLTSTGDQDVTYATSTIDAIATAGDPDDPSFYLGEATVDMPGSVTVPAGGTAELTVTISPDADLELAQYGGYVVLTPEEGAPLSVPFAGFAGDYQALPLLEDLPGLELPVLAHLTDCDLIIGSDCVAGGGWDVVDAGHVYTMRDGDVPTVITHIEHPAQSITFRILRLRPGNNPHDQVLPTRWVALHEEHVGRDSAGFSVRTWDGTRADGKGKKERKVPDGRYMLEVTVVNALGDARNPDHVATWRTPVFEIDRKAGDKPGKPKPKPGKPDKPGKPKPKPGKPGR